VPEQALDRFAETGADGIMIGRGAQRDPWLFSRIVSFSQGQAALNPPVETRKNIFRHYTELLREDGLPEKPILGVLKQLAVKFLRGRPGGAAIRTAALRSMTLDGFYDHAERYFYDTE